MKANVTMNAKNEAISKIQNLTDSMAKEVSDFIDFLKLRKDKKRWEQWNLFQESLHLSDGEVLCPKSG